MFPKLQRHSLNTNNLRINLPSILQSPPNKQILIKWPINFRQNTVMWWWKTYPIWIPDTEIPQEKPWHNYQTANQGSANVSMDTQYYIEEGIRQLSIKNFITKYHQTYWWYYTKNKSVCTLHVEQVPDFWLDSNLSNHSYLLPKVHKNAAFPPRKTNFLWLWGIYR